jgi:hypothetical protein
MKLSSIIWCIVGCRIPSDEIFAEKYETKIMRKEYLGFSKHGINAIEHTSFKFDLTNNRVW